MATSKLELAVGTGQWDAGLKKAQQALNSFTQSQGGLQQALAKDNGDMQKFIQMMGKMDSTANTSKGQMNDYKRVLEQLTAQYNQMSDAQRKSIGQDYLQTIDALKQKFAQAKQQVDDFNRSLGEAGKIKMPETGGGLFGGGKLDGMLQVFGGNLMTKAAGMATGLAMEIGDAVKQGIELAKQGEGIRIAFERLGRGDILDGLRKATHGTVTDLELMKAAVKFNDFKLPVEELGTMLAFAQQKAKDTGQSVDYMVDSIVTGLGRKSLMILDNLGLSANEVKEKMAETGDMTKAVGAIIREQMSKAGDYVETAADRAAQANVSLQNKMEELGRKFAPVEEASNQLWTSMKIGILDVVGGPLANLLNKLTEAGRLMNAYGKIGGNAKVGRMTSNLAGASEGNRQSVYQQQQQKFWQYINPREQQIKDIRAWQRGERGDALQSRINAITEKYGSLDATKIQAEVDAAKKMLADYQQAAKTILNPVKADIDTSGAENNVDSLKKKLKDLEEQRKKAIKAGDTELAKNLTKQINQTKTDISGLAPSALKTTGANNTPKTEEQLNNQNIQKLTQEYISASDDRRKAIEAEIKTLQERNKEIRKLYDMAQGKIKTDGSLPALTQQLKEFQTEQAESANGMEWDKWQKQIDETTEKINILKGILHKDQQATFTVAVNADELEQLQMLLPTEDQTIHINVEEGTVSLPDIPTDDETIKVNVEQGTVNMPDIPTDDKIIRVNILADTAEAMRQVQDMVSDIEGMEVHITPKIEIPDNTEPLTPGQAMEQEIRVRLSEQNMDTDMQTLRSLLEVQIKNNIEGINIPADALIQRIIGEGDNIPDTYWQNLQDQINAKLAEIGIDPIKINFETGGIEKVESDAKATAKSMQSAASAINSVGSALQQIEDPTAKVMGIVAQAIATIAQAYAQALATDVTTKPNIWAFIGAAAASMASMATTINAIHSATGYAEGGIIKGNSYSGDKIGGLVDGSQLVGLDAGELVLTRSMQGNLASQLQDSERGGGYTPSHISGEQIWIALNRYTKRTGRGEMVTWK